LQTALSETASCSIQLVFETRMADTDRPRSLVGVLTAEVEIAAGVDGKIDERRQLARGHVDGETLGHGAEVEQERSCERDGTTGLVNVGRRGS